MIRLFKSAWFIALVAMVLRTAFLIYKAYLIPAEVLATVPFQNEVGNVASALAQGNGFCCLFRQPTGATAWLAPAYPLIVAFIFKLLGVSTLRSFYAAVLLNCTCSSLACIPVFYAGKRIGGTASAVLASWLWTIFPGGIILPFEWIWDTSLSVLLAAVLLWATLDVADSSRFREYVLYGLLWGVSLLTNPALGSLLPFLLGWVLSRRPSSRAQQLRLGLVTVAMILLTCLPWTIRNYTQFHRLIPLRSNFPFEFWSGNNEIFDEHSHEVNRITRYEQTRLYAKLGENAFLDDKWKKARSFVLTHAPLYAQLFGRRIVATWLGTESPWQDFVRSDSLLVRLLFVWNSLTLLGASAGLVSVYLWKRSYLIPLAAYPLVFPVTFYIAHTSLRHRHPCDPILALLMALTITGAGIRFKTE